MALNPKPVQPRHSDGKYGSVPPKAPTAGKVLTVLKGVPVIQTPAQVLADKIQAASPVAAATGWQCKECMTSDPSLFYPSGKITKICVDCYRYHTLEKNAARVRGDGTTYDVGFTQTEFVQWIRQQKRCCGICGVEDKNLYLLGLQSSTGSLVRAVGIDRMNSDVGYQLDNIQLCCFACNKAKGNVFTAEEMTVVAGGISEAWKPRLAAAGVGEHTDLDQADWNHWQIATVSLPDTTCAKCGYMAPDADTSCLACYKYGIVSANANKTRVSGFTPGIEMTLEEFATWYNTQNGRHECHYCRLPEAVLPDIQARTQVGHPLKRLGLDRIDNDRGYSVDNIVLCCFPCNKAKGNVFSQDEMKKQVGPSISKIWRNRVFSEINPNYRPAPNSEPTWN
jgi:5-methylcytosine-specific restriction endonuclease McrA